ncbi:hypothetical protein CTheo_578 [Ceratobasidium theobromae]|uniref:Uncharacterized protein n=1 Tax=Ceratobasidium theobromae TaxID=1582974 RepID=A0A5N5QWS2_9AGAM|nr:hypothetical protein CTheo_578 [Ceratobasidium theobromae]
MVVVRVGPSAVGSYLSRKLVVRQRGWAADSIQLESYKFKKDISMPSWKAPRDLCRHGPMGSMNRVAAAIKEQRTVTVVAQIWGALARALIEWDEPLTSRVGGWVERIPPDGAPRRMSEHEE